MESRKLFINGQWSDALSRAAFDHFNPYTGELCAKVSMADAADVDRTMAAAYAARQGRVVAPVIARALIPSRAARLPEQNRQEFAEVPIRKNGRFWVEEFTELQWVTGSKAKRPLPFGASKS